MLAAQVPVTADRMANVASLSVAISTLDRPGSLARCLDALWSGEVLPAEVIIVDQSCSDDTSSIVEIRRRRGVPLVYIRQRARGLAASQNTAFAHARYPIVAVLDDDCMPDRKWLAVVEESFAAFPAVAALTGRVLPLGAEGDKIYPVSSRLSTIRRKFARKCSPWLVGSGNNFAVRRCWFTKVGGCDERLGPGSRGQGGVDMDLFYRLLRARARIVYEPDSIIYHERQDKAGRIARRWTYGHGMAACCAIRLRQHDYYASRMLLHWLGFRTRLLLAAVWRRQWMSVHEECLVLMGSVKGLVYGWRARGPAA